MKPAVRILTFDIEEWFHLLDFKATRTVESWKNYEQRICKNTDRILELLKNKKQKATFFCLGWVAEKYPQIIRKIDDFGFEVGSHSSYHQLAYELNPQQFREDLQKSLNTLQDIIGKKVSCFRVPGFSITRANAWAIEILIESGITSDSSIFPAPRGHGGFESFGTDKPVIINSQSGSLKEFPINTVSFLGKRIIFSGGGYFRLLPYFLIDRFMRRSQYVMTYFHPRDFDPGQPILKGLPLTRKFKSYYGLSSAFKKLEMLLDNYQFSDMKGAEEILAWEKIELSSLMKSH